MMLGEVVTPSVLRRTFASVPTGVMAVCALVGGRPEGIAVNSFTSVSLDPPLALFCAGHTSETWPRLAGLDALGVSTLATEQANLAQRLAAKGIDRFAGVDWFSTPAGAVLIKGAIAWLECGIASIVEAGDHDVVLLDIRALGASADLLPLIFFRRAYPGLAASS